MHSHHLQLNLKFRLGVRKVTPTAIEKWSKIINAFRQNGKNMQEHVDGVWKNKEVLPDLRYDVDSIADYLTLKLGLTKEELYGAFNEEQNVWWRYDPRGLCFLPSNEGEREIERVDH